MPKIINLLLLVSGLILAGTGLAALHRHPGAWPVLALGAGIGTLALVSDERRKRRAGRRAKAAADARIDALANRPLTAGDSMRVEGSRWTLPGVVVMLLLGAWAVWFGAAGAGADWLTLAGGGCLVATGLLLLARTWSGVGHPALELDTGGIVTPLNGRIAWRDISGIFLRTIATQSMTTHTLLFRVDDFAHRAQRIHWTDRLLARVRLGPLARGQVGPGSRAPGRTRR